MLTKMMMTAVIATVGLSMLNGGAAKADEGVRVAAPVQVRYDHDGHRALDRRVDRDRDRFDRDRDRLERERLERARLEHERQERERIAWLRKHHRRYWPGRFDRF